MDLRDYQARARATDRTSENYENDVRRDVVVALLGIAGELGTLATAYKKCLRDGKAYELHVENMAEEIGDLLWYLAVLADKFGLDLAEVAVRNLQKVSDRWSYGDDGAVASYDAEFPEGERLPRSLRIEFSEQLVAGRAKAIMRVDGRTLGDPLTDNNEAADGYRFHDAFHLAFFAVLGWSPVVRKLLGRKRRSVSAVDESQDGGRAIVIEEGVAALVFEYGEDNGWLDGVRAVDYELIRTIRTMTRRLEVRDQSSRRWEEAIRAGWKVFRQLTRDQGGIVECDLDARRIDIVPP
jgi:NTP pyrophosphatase (non-canonical NTP hydrolase)